MSVSVVMGGVVSATITRNINTKLQPKKAQPCHGWFVSIEMETMLESRLSAPIYKRERETERESSGNRGDRG